MKLSSQFDLPAPPAKVVALFFDPVTMRDCLPGCEELEQVDEKTYRGVLTNEIAHVKFKAGFSAVITSVEEPADSSSPTIVNAVLKGEDRRLGSTIKVDAKMTIAPVGEESRVTYELELAMWGKLGRLGESVIRRRSVEVERQFSENLAAVCAGKPLPHGGPKASKAQKLQQAVSAVPSAGTAQATQAGQAGQPVGAGNSVVEVVSAPSRTQDLPFLIAVAAAAFAYGVILGGRKRGR
ncbi:CoxG family protein [Nocardioides sp. LHG3406-4]|uniref:CoxG family protein n=1 Tax=Nocardioides sp. LHG3406-4 TaxID=2804575 RepID=UPI003CE7320A